VADVPDLLTLRRHRDLVGRESRPWSRRFLLLLLAAMLVLALANVFGQHPGTARAESSDAALELNAPTRLRGGLMFMGRFRIEARRELQHATLVLDPGWVESITLNTVEPSPVGEASRDGRLALDFGHVAAGASVLAFLQFQVNPTNVGRRSQAVELHDGERRLLRLDHDVTVFP
jgi:hypothetical protein